MNVLHATFKDFEDMILFDLLVHRVPDDPSTGKHSWDPGAKAVTQACRKFDVDLDAHDGCIFLFLFSVTTMLGLKSVVMGVEGAGWVEDNLKIPPD